MTWDAIIVMGSFVISALTNWVWYNRGVKDGRKQEQIEELQRRIKMDQSAKHQEEMMKMLSGDTGTSNTSESYKRWRDIENHGF